MGKFFLFVFYQSLLAFAFLSSLEAQTIDTTYIIIEDGWIEKMDRKIAFELSLNNNMEIFKVKTQSNTMLLYPNSKSNLNFSFNFRFISLSIGFAPSFIPGNDDNDKKGRTNSFSIGTSIIQKHWFLNLKYSKNKGYYLYNTKDFMAWENGDPYLQFPDLLYQGLGITTGYNLNSKYSVRSVNSQTERQLKSAGSFCPSIQLLYYIVDDKSSNSDKQKSTNTEFTVNIGYNYNFVYNNYYIFIGASSGIGYLRTNLVTHVNNTIIESFQDNNIFEWTGKFGAGFNGRKFYIGALTSVSEILYRQENTTVKNTEINFNYHIFLGVRFNAPKILNKGKVKLEHFI